MAYRLKTEAELESELFLEVKSFAEKFSYENRDIDETNYHKTISQILVMAEVIDQYDDAISIVSGIK